LLNKLNHFKMNILFALGHPAHYHLFKNTSSALKMKGHNVHYVITQKDILEDLLKSNKENYSVLAEREVRGNLFNKFLKILKSTRSLIKIARKKDATILIGCLSQIAYAGKILRIPSIFVGEDDFSYTWLQGIITYPFVTKILAPKPTNVGPFDYKRISYDGYQKLSYLHSNYFKSNRTLNTTKKKQILIRLVNLSAYHDVTARGLNNHLLVEFIQIFKEIANIYISAERKLPEMFEEYRINIDPNKMHEFLLNSDLFIGDSQSMAVEASLLGVPNIRINNFASKISVLNEIEFKYKLTKSLEPEDAYKITEISKEILLSKDIYNIHLHLRDIMLVDKIDVTAFMVWFIENYPESVKIMKENPDYQLRFK